MVYEVLRDIAAFVGASASAIVGFATWQTVRAHRKPLQVYALHTAAAETVYLVPFSAANLTPSDRQVDDAWLDLTPPASPPRGAPRVFKMVITALQSIVPRKRPDLRLLAVRHALRHPARGWVRLAQLDVVKPLYVPFKVSGFSTEEGTLFFAVIPGDEDLLNKHGLPAGRDFLKMPGVKAERAFIAQFVVKDDRGKTAAARVLVFPRADPGT